MNWLISNLEPIMAIVGTAVTLATMITALTKSKKDDEVVGKVSAMWQKIRSALGLFSIKK